MLKNGSAVETTVLGGGRQRVHGTATGTVMTLKAAVPLFGNYVAAGFHLADDGAGRTAVTYPPDTAAAHPVLAAPRAQTAIP